MKTHKRESVSRWAALYPRYRRHRPLYRYRRGMRAAPGGARP